MKNARVILTTTYVVVAVLAAKATRYRNGNLYFAGPVASTSCPSI